MSITLKEKLRIKNWCRPAKMRGVYIRLRKTSLIRRQKF